MKTIYQFLTLLTEKYPPPNKSKHNITLDGDILLLTVFLDNFIWASIEFNKSDFDKSPEQLMKEIEPLLKEEQKGK